MVSLFLSISFWLNAPCSLDGVEILSQVVGKSLEEVIRELNLKRETVHLGGGMDNTWFEYCGFYDDSNNHVIIWPEIPKIILPNRFEAEDYRAECQPIFESVLNSKVRAISVGDGRVKTSKESSILPAINECNGKRISDVINDLGLKIRKKVGYYDFLNSIYLVRVLDSRNLVFEFQVGEEEFTNTEGKVKYKQLKFKKFEFLRVFTSKKINLRGYTYNLKALN